MTANTGFMCESTGHDSLIAASLITSTFDFEVVSLDAQGRELKRDRSQGGVFTEILKNGIPLEMIQLPARTAQIGSPTIEEGRLDSEKEVHNVTLPSFFMSRYPITQAQWRTIALLPEVVHPLDPEPSRFKGLNRPVEQISWYDAVEFCDRLSRATERLYRLPTEVEWEYACRAGTTTPFHFGETLTTDVANYRGENHYGKQRGQQRVCYNGAYAQGPTGIDRKETTEVGHFQTANSFGLYDMHGNVWEWCASHPDERWVDASRHDCQEDSTVLRGGSWRSSPAVCRAASCLTKVKGYKEAFVGFRVIHSITENPSNSKKPLESKLSQNILSNSQVGRDVTIGRIDQSITIHVYGQENVSSDT